MNENCIAEIRARHAATEAYQQSLTDRVQMHDDRGYLLAEIERLRIGLHRVSLASQNSMASKNECGRIARETLEGEP